MRYKQNNAILKVKMYILSLFLLFVFVIISTVDYKGLCAEKINWYALLKANIIPIVCVAFLIVCRIFYCQFKHKLDGTAMLPLKVTKVSNRNADCMAFLITYIIPLVFFDFTSKRQVTILVLLLITIGIMYVKTDMFISNPTLVLVGYKIYEIQTDDDNIHGTMISQNEIHDGESIRYIRLGSQAYFVRKV